MRQPTWEETQRVAGPGSGPRRATGIRRIDTLAVVEPEEGLGRRPEGPRLLDDLFDHGQPECDAGGQGGGRRLADSLGTGLEASLGESPPIHAAQSPRAPAAAGQGLEGGPGQTQDVHGLVGFGHGATVVESRHRINAPLP